MWIRAITALALGLCVTIWSPHYYVTIGAALLLPIVAGRYALATVVFLVITAREAPDGRGFDYVTALGSQLYYQGKVPVINFLALSAIVVAVVGIRRNRVPIRVTRTAWVLLGLLGALALLAFTVGIVYGQSAFSAANQNSRNFTLAAVGVAAGLLIMAFPAEMRSVKIAGISGLGILVAAAVFAVATGQAADERVSRYFTYYDSALPAVATAILGAVLVSQARKTPATAWLAMGLSVTLVLIGFRLTIWLAAAVVLASTWALSRTWTTVWRRVAVCALALMAGVLVLPGMRSDVTHRLLGAASASPASSSSSSSSPSPASAPAPTRTPILTPSATTPVATRSAAPAIPALPAGAGGEDVAAESSQGHFQDIRIAWSYVREHPWTGIGPQHPQLPGLASDKTQVLYVHNEWLLDWLRFGPGAVVLVTAFLLVVALLAIRTLADRTSSTIHRAAAVFGLMTPICLLPFPYLSESSQWPLLIGIAAGILASTQPGHSQPSGDNPLVDAAAPTDGAGAAGPIAVHPEQSRSQTAPA